jgi:hypothetical protein
VGGSGRATASPESGSRKLIPRENRFESSHVADSRYYYSPVPVSVIIWGLPPPLSAICIVPDLGPEAWGENVAVIVQFPLGAIEEPQSSVSVKSPGFVPPIVMPVIPKVTVLLVLVTLKAED